MRLYPEIVEAFFNVCLFRQGEKPEKMVKVEGIKEVQFDTERLKSLKTEIIAMLDELPDQFRKSGGGGASFLDASFDKYGRQWTGLQMHMEQLFLLGIGIGKVRLLFPRRESLSTLPGGIPYYIID
jgi:hypothetical protein